MRAPQSAPTSSIQSSNKFKKKLLRNFTFRFKNGKILKHFHFYKVVKNLYS